MSILTNQKTSPGSNKDIVYYIHSILCILITFGFGYIPPIAPLTVIGMKIIGIFLGLLYGWIFVGLIWPSLLGLLALPIIGYMKVNAMFAASFGDPIVIMMLFIFIFSAMIDESGLSRFISLWFITRKSIMGKPWLFTFAFLMSVYVLGALTSSSPAIIIGWSILYGVCGVLGYKKGDKYPTMMVFGIVFSAQLGMSLMPFKQVPLVSLGAYQKMSKVPIDFLKYMLVAGLVGLACVTLFVLVGKLFIKPDMSPLRNMNLDVFNVKDELHLKRTQKIVMFFLALLILLLILPSVLPATLLFSKFLTVIGGTGVVILIVGIMCFLKVDGEPLMNFKKMENKGVSWGIVLLLAAVQPLSAALTSDATGFNPFLISILDPIFGGKSAVFFLIFMAFIGILLTNLCNNGAVAVLLMPVAYTYSVAMNLNPAITAIIVTLGVHIAFMTPAASASAALLFGNDWTDSKAIFKIGTYTLIFSYFSIVVLGLLVGNIVF
jgi:solute carrier family 13 (sodium-dependent dicarboxylate transporter), member 2/3/5